MRPIDADWLLEQTKAIHKEVNSINQDYNTGFHSATSQMQGLIASAPTLDVELGRRGKWIKKGSKILLCTNCLCAALFGYGSTACLPSPFCPNCGAKMEDE